VDYAGITDWQPVLSLYAAEGARAPSAAIAHASSPIVSVAAWRSPVLVIQTDNDHNVPFGQSVQLVEALRTHDVPFQLLVLPDESHDLLLFRSWLTYFHAQSDFRDRRLGLSSSPPAAPPTGR